MTWPADFWPHQLSGCEEWVAAQDEGDKRILITAPTGAGKSKMMRAMLERIYAEGKTASLYSHRRMLTTQLRDTLSKANLPFGVRAAGFDPDHSAPIQLCSVQTEAARDGKVGWSDIRSDYVIVDEPHAHKGTQTQSLINKHVDAGAVLTGFTATPVGLGGMYTRLIKAGTNSELRKCGAHVWCEVFGPSEIDAKALKKSKSGEMRLLDEIRDIMTPVIFGEVYKHWLELNPEQKPTILFAPGVQESMWFVDLFQEQGIPAAHIDGKCIYLGKDSAGNPILHDSKDEKNRKKLFAASRRGDIPIISNRFVLREGIDLPHLYHCILATTFSSICSYLQAVGRLLRSHPSLDHVILQDHGGNFWRHGSPNADRDWELEMTEESIAEERRKQILEKKEPEPITCPKCFKIRLSGPKCLNCGYQHCDRSRMVIQMNGTLKRLTGNIFRERPTSLKSDTQKHWERQFYRGRNADLTFNQVRGLFFKEHHYYPPADMALMPVHEADWNRKVRAVKELRKEAKGE